MRNSIIFLSIIFICNVNAQSFTNAGILLENIKPTSTFRIGKTNLFNQIYVESGVKMSSNSDTIGALHLGLIGFQHQLSKKLTLFHSYNYLSQNNYSGGVNQGSYYTNFEYKVNNKFKLNLATSYINNTVRINENAATKTLAETFINHNFFGLLSASINYKQLYIKPLLAASNLNKQIQIQTGAELLFDTKNNEVLVFGLGVYHFKNFNTLSTLIKPSISYLINDELNISLDYFYTNTINYSDQNGYIIYNSPDKSIDRTTLCLRYEFANNLYLFGIYQLERKQYNTTSTNYHFNSLFLGVKYNL